MAQATKIEWSDAVWNFLRGCSRVSEGCGSARGGGCYAEVMAARFSGPGMPYEGIATYKDGKARWTGEISFHEDILLKPLSWKKPRRVFVNSMSDLFHEKVTDEMLDKAFAVMALTPQHTYQILTKRPERMLKYFANPFDRLDAIGSACKASFGKTLIGDPMGLCSIPDSVYVNELPLPNVWLGVSVEDQKTADERIEPLLLTPAAVRWLSVEPLLGPVDLSSMQGFGSDDFNCLNDYYDNVIPRIDWVVVGGESGPGARPCDIAWIRSIIHQCTFSGVPVFVKQLGANVAGRDCEHNNVLD